MSKFKGLSNLADHFKTCVNAQLCATLDQKMVEAHCACIVLENERRAGLVLGMSLNVENVLVTEIVEDFVLSTSCAFEGFSLRRRR